MASRGAGKCRFAGALVKNFRPQASDSELFATIAEYPGTEGFAGRADHGKLPYHHRIRARRMESVLPLCTLCREQHK